MWRAALTLGLMAAPAAIAQPAGGETDLAVSKWGLNDVGHGGFTFTPGPDGVVAFGAPKAGPGQWANASVQLDAAPWRGKLVEVRVRMRVRSGEGRLYLRVDRPKPNPSGFFDNMADRPVPPGAWSDVRVRGFVDEDALTVNAGAYLTGAAAIELAGATIREIAPSSAPPSPEAAAYLDQAIAALKRLHIRSAEMDWPALTARARRQIGGARTPADTYLAIRALLGTLGDHHSTFVGPQKPGPGPGARPRPPAPATPGATAAALPAGSLVEGRIGLVALPGIDTFSGEGKQLQGRYVATGRETVARLAPSAACGWILDLRGDSGGNMWPMLASVEPLIGREPFGWFVGPRGERVPWRRAEVDGEAAGAPPPIATVSPPPRVAVLVGPMTGSSGEAVAIAFLGLPGARSFGQPSAGYTTANQTERLGDGAVLAIASGWEQDRRGRDYRERIVPDEAAAPGAEIAAAARWLKAACAGRP